MEESLQDLIDDLWFNDLDFFVVPCEPFDDPKYDIVGIRGCLELPVPGSYRVSEEKSMDFFYFGQPSKSEPTKLGFSVTTSYKGGIHTEIGSDTILVRKYTSVHHPVVDMLLFPEKVSCNTFEIGNSMVLPKTIIGMFKKSSSFTMPRKYEAGWAPNYGRSEASSPVLYGDGNNFSMCHTIDCSDTMGSMIQKVGFWSAHKGVKPVSQRDLNHGDPDSEHRHTAAAAAAATAAHVTGNRGLLSDFIPEHGLYVQGGGKVIIDAVVLPNVLFFPGLTSKLGHHSGPVVLAAGAGRGIGIALVWDVLMLGRSITGGAAPDAAANRVSENFIIDSGAAVHATGDIAVFYEINMEQTGRAIRVANGHSLQIRGRGSVSFGTFMLRDVKYVPGLIKSVISVSQLLKQDYTPDFRPDGCFIRDAQNQVVGHARPVNGLFQLDHAAPVQV